MDLLRGQVDMVPVEHLGDDAPLRLQAPAAPPQPYQEITHFAEPNSDGTRTGMLPELDVTLTWIKSNVGCGVDASDGALSVDTRPAGLAGPRTQP